MKTITILRRVAQTGGLIALWAVLYPLIKTVIRGYATYVSTVFEWADIDYLYEYEESIAVGFLLYFTFWFWIYLDGFFKEWEIAKFDSIALGTCLIRWTALSIGLTLLPPFIYNFMYTGINVFTTVPRYATYTTAIIYAIFWLIATWNYPSRRIAEVRSWKRSQDL